MSSRDYVALEGLLAHEGWAVLERLWLEEITEIEESRDKAAGRGHESAWRYWAGQEKGFKRAIVKAKLRMAELENEDETRKQGDDYDQLLNEIRGVKQP